MGELFDIRMKNHANHFYEFKGKSLEKFHAAEDEQAVRDQVFNTITTLDINKNIVFSVIMEKKKSFSWNNDNFYNHQRNAVKYLLEGILYSLEREKDDTLIICFDSMPGTNKKDKDNMLVGIKQTIKSFFEKKNYVGIYHVFDELSCANPYLQITDYI